MPFRSRLLWVDCTAGALAGVIVIALSGWLSRVHGLPREVLLFIGAVNLLYACCSFALAIRRERPLYLIHILVAANLAWVPVCIGLAITFRHQATMFGIGALGGEAIFVGGLAVLEWKWRHQLATTATLIQRRVGSRAGG